MNVRKGRSDMISWIDIVKRKHAGEKSSKTILLWRATVSNSSWEWCEGRQRISLIIFMWKSAGNNLYKHFTIYVISSICRESKWHWSNINQTEYTRILHLSLLYNCWFLHVSFPALWAPRTDTVQRSYLDLQIKLNFLSFNVWPLTTATRKERSQQCPLEY